MGFQKNILIFMSCFWWQLPNFINFDIKDKNGEPVKVRRKKKTYKEIAMLNEMSEEESVRIALQKGYEEMRQALKEAIVL